MGHQLAPSTASVVSLALALSCTAVTASAQPEGLDLQWFGPTQCQGGPEVRAKVERLLGTAEVRPTGRWLKAEVRLRRETSTRYVADLLTETKDGMGRRRLEGESCDAMVLASSLVIALAIDPTLSLDARGLEEPASSPRQEPQAQVALTDLAEVPGLAAPVAPARFPISPYLQLSLGTLLQLMGGPSLFASAGLGLRYGPASLELGAAFHQPRRVYLVDPRRMGAELDLKSGELLGCLAALRHELASLSVCAGGELEYLSARAFGVSDPGSGSVLLLAGVGTLRGRFRATSWFSATLDGGVSARQYQPTFVVLGVGHVFAIPGVSPFARTGIALEF